MMEFNKIILFEFKSSKNKDKDIEMEKKIKKFPIYIYILKKQLKYIQSSSIWSTTWIEKWTWIDHKKKKR
jgi:hypothetical protein